MHASNFKGADSARALTQSQGKARRTGIRAGAHRRIMGGRRDVMKTFGTLLIALALAGGSAPAQAQTKVHWYGHAALDAKGLGGRMVEMKPGETRGF